MRRKRSVLEVRVFIFQTFQPMKAKKQMTGTKYIKLQPSLNPPKSISNGVCILAPQERQILFLPFVP